MQTRGPLLIVALLVVAVLLAAPVAVGQRWSLRAPFTDLHLVPRVTTSNDEYSIWLYRSPERFRIVYPGGRRRFTQDAAGADALYSALSVWCRADGRSEGLSGPSPLRAQLRLPMHPGAPDVYSVLHPMYWILGLSGREFERIPVLVDLAGRSVADAHLVRRRIAYGRPRPDVELDLPGEIVLGLFREGSPMRVAVSGGGADLDLWFPAATALVAPAGRMFRHCRAVVGPAASGSSGGVSDGR